MQNSYNPAFDTENNSEDRLIFLISLPRSGSTLLQRILGGHDSVFTAGESWLMLHPLYALKHDRIQADYEPKYAEIALREIINQFPEKDEIFYKAVRRYSLTFYDQALENSGKSFFLDKTPRYYMILNDLIRVFPNAHYVFLFRNPMAVLSSMLKTWFRNNPQALKASRNYQDLTIAPKQILEGIEVIGNKASILHYEHLVENPRQTIQNLCSRLGMVYNDEMLYYGRKPFIQSRLGDPVSVHQNDHPVTENIEKWVTNLKTSSLKDFGKRVLKEIGRDTIDRMGYDMDAIRKKLDHTNHQTENLNVRRSGSKLIPAIANSDGSTLPLPVVICQMGKVGSTSLMTSLNKHSIPNQQIHFLSPSSIEKTEAYYRNINPSGIPDHLRRSREIYQLTTKAWPGNKWKIISLVRDPIARAISSVFQNMSDLFPGIEYCETASAVDQLETHLLHQLEEFDETSDFACTWFDNELKAVFGFDIFQHSFDKDSGYDIFKTEKADFLIIRTENLTGCCPTALKNFLQIESFELSNDNVGREKPYRNVYKQLLNKITIPADTLNRIYGSRFVRHFYTNSEIETFKQRWQKPSPPTLSCLSKGNATVDQRYPKITIVTPSFNQAEYLEACIKSILNQNYPNLEYIIMDGGSTDGSVDIIKKYASKLYYWQSQPDGGHYAAVNKGFEKSSGEIMAWLNSDDMLHKNALFNIALAFTGYPDVEWIQGRNTIWDAAGKVVNIEKKLKRWERQLILDGDFKWIQQESTFWKRSLWERAGGYIDTDFDLAGDLELWCRFFRHATMYRVDEVLGGYRFYGNQRAQLFMPRYIKQADRIIAKERSYFASSSKNRLIRSPEPLSIASSALKEFNHRTLTDLNCLHKTPESLKYGQNIAPQLLKAYEKAHTLIADGDQEKAEAALTEILTHAPDFAIIHNDLGVLNYKTGRINAAHDFYQKAVALDPHNVTFRKNLAEFLLVVYKDIQGALALYLELLKENQNDTEVLYGIGQACLAASQLNDAKVFFERILSVQPQHHAAAKALNTITASSGNHRTISEDSHHPGILSQRHRFRVTAVISTYNAERFIAKRLQNLVDQTLYKKGELEIIVVDSNSPENERAVVEQFSEQYSNIVYHRTSQRETVYAAWNRGIELAHGEYFVNANTDDRFSPDALEVMADSLDAYPEYDAAYGNWVYTRTPNDTFESSAAKRLFVYPEFHPGLFFYLQITSHASFVRRSVIDKIGPFDGGYSVFGDREFMFRFAATGHKALKLDRTVGLYLENPTSVERANKEIGMQECAALYDAYLTPEKFARLTGRDHDVSPKTLSRAYSEAGCFGMGLYQVDGLSVHALGSPTRLFAKAIELDPGNIEALNNMGVIAQYRQAKEDALRFLENAASQANDSQIKTIDHNQKMVSLDVSDPDQLRFLYPSDFRPIKVVEAKYNPNSVNISLGDKKSAYLKSKRSTDKKRQKKKSKEKGLTTLENKKNATPSPLHCGPKVDDKIWPAWDGYLRENHTSAQVALQQILTEHPNHWAAYELLVNVMLQSGQNMDISNQLQDLENRSNLPARMMALIGHGYEASGNLEKATDFVAQALEIDSECARAWNLKGVIAYRNGHVPEAAQFFHKASECDENWGDPWTNMGTLHWEHGDQDKALNCFETGFQLSPTGPNVATTYHIAISETGQYDRARKIFEDVVSRHLDFRKGRFLLVDVLIRLEAYHAALDHIEAILVGFGADAQLLEAAKAIRSKMGPLTIKKDKHPSLSLCMIVNNEEKYMARCLASLKPMVDEMIVVDTGSTDTTRDIAEVFGAKVFDFEWNSDFADARNHSLEKASGDWILVMDADETIAQCDHGKILDLIKKSNNDKQAYVLTTRNYTDRQDSAGYSENTGQYKEEMSTGWVPSIKVRLFQNQEGVHFVFPVHEQVDPVLSDMGISLIESSIPVHHYGKLDQARTAERWQTYYDIGHKKLASQSDNDHALKELAIQAGLLSKWKEAATHWKSFIDRNPDSVDGYLNLTRVMANCGDYQLANQYANKAFQLAGDRSETSYNLALSELQTGQAAKAAQTAAKMVDIFPDDPDGKLLHALAEICAGKIDDGTKLFYKLSEMVPIMSLLPRIRSILGSIKSAGFDDWIVSLNAELSKVVCLKDIAVQPTTPPANKVGVINKTTAGADKNASTIIKKAVRYYERENYQASIDSLMHIVAAESDHWEAYELLVDVMLQSGQSMDIPNQLQDLENRSDLPARMMALIGHGYEASGNLEKAADFVGQALTIDPECARAWNLKGVIAYRNGHGSEAAQFFHKASECDGNWGDPWTNMGTLHWDHGDKDKALDCFETGFQLSPTGPNVATTYHIAISETGQYSRAREHFEEIVSRYPDFRRGRFLFVDVLIRLDAYHAALDQIEAVLVRFGADAQLLDAAKAVRAKVGPLTIKKNIHPSLSLCMIVKNEEKYLARCIANLKPMVDEMIIVDTGSTDATRDIAKVFGAKVFDYEWKDDFAAARNHSLEKAVGDWNLIMDADEVISTKDHNKLRKLIATKKKHRCAFMVVTRNYTNRYNIIGWEPNKGQYPEAEAGAGWIPSEKVRLFPNDKNIRFEYPVHEVVGPSLARMNIPIVSCPYPVHHYGKLDHKKESEKDLHYFNIGIKKLTSDNKDPVPIREMAIQATKLGKHEEAIGLWKKFIQIEPKNAKCYINMATSYAKLKQYSDAKKAAEIAVKFSPKLKEGHLNLGLSELHLGNEKIAEKIFYHVVKKHHDYFSAILLLASSQLCQGKTKEAANNLKPLRDSPVWNRISYAIQDLVESLNDAGWIELTRNLIAGSIALECSNRKIMEYHHQFENMAA